MNRVTAQMERALLRQVAFRGEGTRRSRKCISFRRRFHATVKHRIEMCRPAHAAAWTPAPSSDLAGHARVVPKSTYCLCFEPT